MTRVRRQALAASGVREALQVPRLGSHWTHGPIGQHEVGTMVQLTQRICVAGAMLASQVVDLGDYDVLDDLPARQRTARLMLVVAASARETQVDPGQAVLSRRQLITQRMLPNWLRPLSRTIVCLLLLATYLAAGWASGALPGAAAWLVVVLLALHFVLLPRLQPQYRTPNFANPPDDVLREIVGLAEADLPHSGDELEADEQLLFPEYGTRDVDEPDPVDLSDEDEFADEVRAGAASQRRNLRPPPGLGFGDGGTGQGGGLSLEMLDPR